jgi:glycyl-radical enzyme activating protein
MDRQRVTGRIVSIQRCSIHDGPGLRTTIFMKGCQLNCPWCHNPEAIAFSTQEMHYPEKCIGCGECADGCFSGSRTAVGTDMVVADVMLEVYEDEPFYDQDGGVTLSGGEPLCQLPFVLALLDECRLRNINTALESNLCVPQEAARLAFERIDLLMADLKFDLSDKHMQWTGMGNEQVKANLILASGMGIPLVVRTPVIPGVNDDREEIRNIARFAASLSSLQAYELLSYHPLGSGKAKALGFAQPGFERPSLAQMQSLARVASDAGVHVRIDAKPFFPESCR